MTGSGKIIIVGDLFPTNNNVPYFEQGEINSLFGGCLQALI